MRATWLVALTFALMILGLPHASAAPLCESDVSRGGVPATLAVEACVGTTDVTLRNSSEVPVVVQADGDLGTPIRELSPGGQTSAVTRLALGGDDDVLMPGDVARWPLGSAAAELTVTDLEPATIPTIVADLRGFLPRRGDTDDSLQASAAFAVVVREVAAAVEERSACQGGKNFLRTTACDMDAATRIGRVVSGELSRIEAAGVAPVVLDVGRWDDWSPGRPTSVGPPTGRTIRLASVVPPEPPPPPVTLPAPASPAPVPPAPVLPAVPAVPAAPPAPTAPAWPGWQAWLDRLHAGSNGDGNGNGNGNGHGNGNGRGHDKD